MRIRRVGLRSADLDCKEASGLRRHYPRIDSTIESLTKASAA